MTADEVNYRLSCSFMQHIIKSVYDLERERALQEMSIEQIAPRG